MAILELGSAEKNQQKNMIIRNVSWKINFGMKAQQKN